MGLSDTIGPSVIRTVVPLIYGALITWAATKNIDLGQYEDLLTTVITTVISAIVYAALRFAEEKGLTVASILLGSTKKPTYEGTVKADASSPTGQSAAEAAPESLGIPENQPVAVIPVENPDDYDPQHAADEAK